MLNRFIRVLSIVLTATIFASCGGGGGGGGSFFGAAKVSINANPRTIFVGDRTLVSTSFEEVNEDGIIVAFRYPTNFAYVRDSAKLTVNKQTVDIVPLVNDKNSGKKYLVFVFSADTFGKDRRGAFEFQLLGESAVDTARIEVDPRIRDTHLPDDRQFNIKNPVFGTDEGIDVRIKSS